MSMLSVNIANFKDCISGCAEFFPSYQNGQYSLHVGVRCQLGDDEFTDVALLDTGAQWSMIGGETAELLENSFGAEDQTIIMNSRFGKHTCALRRLSINLVADEDCGNNLTFDATVAVAADYFGPVILGYKGFLEHIRFGLEPSIAADGNNNLYFGTVVE